MQFMWFAVDLGGRCGLSASSSEGAGQLLEELQVTHMVRRQERGGYIAP